MPAEGEAGEGDEGVWGVKAESAAGDQRAEPVKPDETGRVWI